MLENLAYFGDIALAKPSCHHDLHANGKSLRDGCENEVIQSSHHGGPKFGIAYMPEKNGVHQHDKGLCQIAENDRVRDLPDFLTESCMVCSE